MEIEKKDKVNGKSRGEGFFPTKIWEKGRKAKKANLGLETYSPVVVREQRH